MMGLQDPAVSQFTEKQVLEKTRLAADTAWRLLEEITLLLKPGIRESGAKDQALALMRDRGVTKHWHQPYIRFGSHSILTFADKPEDDRVLGEDDIAYIDLGPVIDAGGLDVEGDVGHTVVFGDNLLFHDLKATSERLFHEGVAYWKNHRPTGVELYDYLKAAASSAGYDFHLNPAGHLIGTFPHKGWRNGLNTYPYPPEPGIWILEIQIRHPEQPYGAFYEAVLL